jgi:lysine 6-dehydrogenase
MKIIILGCGYHGRGIAYDIASASDVSEVLVVDRNASLAQLVAKKANISWNQLDIRDGAALKALLQGTDLVFNAIGPYHRYALDVIDAAIDSGVNYADMNDDHEAAEELFLNPNWDERAKKAGVAVLTGLGMAPGLSGILARLGFEQFDSAEIISIKFVWNYSIKYPAAIQHFLRINSGRAPQYIGGNYTKPGFFAEREIVRFLDPVGTRPVYYTGIIDPITIPISLSGVKETTAKGAFLQPEANALLECMVKWGMTSYDPVQGTGTNAMEFLMAYLVSPQGQPYFHINPLNLPMAVRVEVAGLKKGQKKKITYEAHDYTRRGSTSTSAIAALMLARGNLSFAGVRAPESCIDPVSFLRTLVSQGNVKIFEWWESDEPKPLSF